MRLKFSILFLIIFSALQSISAQQAYNIDRKPMPHQHGMISEKIKNSLFEYMHNRLNLSNKEIENFDPVFRSYFVEMRQMMHQNRRNNFSLIDHQQKMLEIRIKYREQFTPIIGLVKADMVFVAEREFMSYIRKELNKRHQERIENQPH